jgi:hypothetical protein
MVKNNESSVVMTAPILAIEKAGELKAVPQEGSNGFDEQSEPDGSDSWTEGEWLPMKFGD